MRTKMLVIHPERPNIAMKPPAPTMLGTTIGIVASTMSVRLPGMLVRANAYAIGIDRIVVPAATPAANARLLRSAAAYVGDVSASMNVLSEAFPIASRLRARVSASTNEPRMFAGSSVNATMISDSSGRSRNSPKKAYSTTFRTLSRSKRPVTARSLRRPPGDLPGSGSVGVTAPLEAPSTSPDTPVIRRHLLREQPDASCWEQGRDVGVLLHQRRFTLEGVLDQQRPDIGVNRVLHAGAEEGPRPHHAVDTVLVRVAGGTVLQPDVLGTDQNRNIRVGG